MYNSVRHSTLVPRLICSLVRTCYYLLTQRNAQNAQRQQVRDLFKENVFLSKDPMDRMTLIDSTLPKAVKADEILRTLRREKREATSEEQALIDEVEACREIIIQVCTPGKLRDVPQSRCLLLADEDRMSELMRRGGGRTHLGMPYGRCFWRKFP